MRALVVVVSSRTEPKELVDGTFQVRSVLKDFYLAQSSNEIYSLRRAYPVSSVFKVKAFPDCSSYEGNTVDDTEHPVCGSLRWHML